MNAATETTAPAFPAPTGSLHLQYVGEQMAIEVEALVPGCMSVWNSGALELVRNVERVSPKFYALTTSSVRYEDGKLVAEEETFTRRCKVGRMIGYSPKATARFHG